MLWRELTHRSSVVNSRPRLGRAFVSTDEPMPRLPISSKDQVIPKDMYDLQERMVTKFQFEKLIPDNLQQIYSEYVGQLEKDYAELYPLIKEFNNKTEVDFQNEQTKATYNLFSSNNDGNFTTVVTRPSPDKQGLQIACAIVRPN